MTTINRIRTEWSGFQGAPGVSTFYATDVGAFSAPLFTFIEHLSLHMPPDVHLVTPGEGDMINDANGELVSAWTESMGGGVDGSGNAVYSAPVGFQVRWLTETIVDGHRLKGRTFVVPCSADQFHTNGQLNATAKGQIQTDVDTFIGDVGENMLVWHRPRPARAASDLHPVARPARAGSSAFVTAGQVMGSPVVLTSRRD